MDVNILIILKIVTSGIVTMHIDTMKIVMSEITKSGKLGTNHKFDLSQFTNLTCQNLVWDVIIFIILKIITSGQ